MVFSSPPEGGLTFSSPTSPVPGNCSPLTGQQFLGVETWVTHYLQNTWPCPKKSCWKWAGIILCPKAAAAAAASVATTTLQGVGHAGSIIPIPNSPSQTGTDGVLAKNTRKWPRDLPHWRGGCHPAHVQLPGANMSHTRISPVLERAASLCTWLHLPADTSQSSHPPLPHVLTTELSPLWLTSPL